MELSESRKLIITGLIKEFKKSNTYSMYETDFVKFIDDESETRIITEILKYKLELITAPTKQTYRLTKKGIIFTSFENLETEKEKKFKEDITIVNYVGGDNYGNQSSNNFSNNPITNNTTENPKSDLKENSIILKFWKLISENKLISSFLVVIILWAIKEIFGINLKN